MNELDQEQQAARNSARYVRIKDDSDAPRAVLAGLLDVQDQLRLQINAEGPTGTLISEFVAISELIATRTRELISVVSEDEALAH